MTNVIIPHSYYRERSQIRRLKWIRRKELHRRTGRTPPLVWADPEPVEVERTHIIDWRAVRNG